VLVPGCVRVGGLVGVQYGAASLTRMPHHHAYVDCQHGGGVYFGAYAAAFPCLVHVTCPLSDLSTCPAAPVRPYPTTMLMSVCPTTVLVCARVCLRACLRLRMHACASHLCGQRADHRFCRYLYPDASGPFISKV